MGLKVQSGRVIWMTGLSGSGKSTLADALAQALRDRGHSRIYRLDGDTLRDGLNVDLGFSQEDRNENLRRAAQVARLFADEGYTVIASFITPLESQRQKIRALFPASQFDEIWISASLDVCEQRDPKGLYQKARRGLIPEFTGIGSVYESPAHPDLSVDTGMQTEQESLNYLLRSLALNI